MRRPTVNVPPELLERMMREQRRGLHGHMSGITELTQRPAERPAGQVYIPRSTGKRFASIVIAASDTPVETSEVDFKCSGSDDQDALYEAFTYGHDDLGLDTPRMLLLAGTYNFSDKFSADQVGTCIIEGEGYNLHHGTGTVIDGGGTADLFTSLYEGIVFKNFLVQNADVAFDLQIGAFTLDGIGFYDAVTQPVLLTQTGGGSYTWYNNKLLNLWFGTVGGAAGSYLIDADWTADFIDELLIMGCTGGASAAGWLRLKNTVSGHNNGLTLVGNDMLSQVLIYGWDEVTCGPNRAGFADWTFSHIDDLSFVGNVNIGDLTLNTIAQFAHSGNIVNGTYTESSVTTKAGVSIGIT